MILLWLGCTSPGAGLMGEVLTDAGTFCWDEASSELVSMYDIEGCTPVVEHTCEIRDDGTVHTMLELGRTRRDCVPSGSVHFASCVGLLTESVQYDGRVLDIEDLPACADRR